VEIPFDLEEVSVSKKPEAVKKHNPLVRIPTLILDDGEVLVESFAILDAIDEMAGPEMSLTPPSGRERRQVLKITAIGVGSMEKAQWAFYEGRHRPAEKIHQPWIEHNEQQVRGGLEYLDGQIKKAGTDGWIAGTSRMTQADITSAVTYSFAKTIRPDLDILNKVDHLAEFTERCEAMDIFRTSKIPA
jgi:glutathione S-transferase